MGNPLRSANFVSGEWRGQLTVLEAARDMTVLADDGDQHTGRSNPFTGGVLGDLALTMTVAPESVRLGQSLNYQATVRNLGLTRVTGVMVTNRLPVEVNYVSASSSQGSCGLVGREVVCALGALEPGGGSTVQIEVSTLTVGSVTNRAKVNGVEDVPDFSNNLAQAVATVTPPVIVVRDAAPVAEGDSGTVAAEFEVIISQTDREVRVDYATADGTARAGLDYASTSGTLIFPAGAGNQTLRVRVPVIDDPLTEERETFVLNLSNPVNAAIQDAHGVGTILDNEVPGLSVAAAGVREGDDGTTDAVFTVGLFPMSSQRVEVEYFTSDGTAIAGSDYVSSTGRIAFAPGVAQQTVVVKIVGDASHELDEIFGLELRNPTGAPIGKGRATGTILNDDFPTISINDTNVNLSIPGTSNAVLVARLSYPSLHPVQFDFATADGTATEGTDYTGRSGTIVFPTNGIVEATLSIPVSQNALSQAQK